MKKKMKIAYLQETDFQLQMEQVVEPYLDRCKKQGRFTGYGGGQIVYYSYQCSHPGGIIVISHGFSEFAEKYQEMVFYFLQAGYAVFVPEHRGHGGSQRKVKNPEKVYVKSFEEYVRDLRIFLNQIVKPYQKEIKKEMILFAHSMGGAIGALYLERYPGDFQKAVLSSPMIQMRVGKVPYRTAMTIAKVCCLCGLGRTFAAGQHGFIKRPEFERSSCLSQARYLYAYEKRLHNRKYQTTGAACAWVAAAARAAEYIQDETHIRKIRIPVLVFAAGREHMVNTDEICRFAAKLQNVRLVWLLEAKHEAFHAQEQVRIRFYDELFRYLQEPVSKNGRKQYGGKDESNRTGKGVDII